MVERVLAILAERVAALSSGRELHRSITEMEHLVLCDLLTGEEEQQVVAASPHLLASSQAVFTAFETTLELSMAALMLSGSVKAVESPANLTQNYLQRYRTLAGNEAALASITDGDRVLFIGSGPLPITALEYARQTGCHVDCVDHSEPAIETSTRIIRECAGGTRLRVLHARGQDWDVRGYDVILVGVLAQPKLQILTHIDGNADANTRLLCRTTQGLRQFIYPRTEPTDLQRFHPAAFSRARGDQILSTQLLTALGGAGAWERPAAPDRSIPTRGAR